jgi:hypothetical protein
MVGQMPLKYIYALSLSHIVGLLRFGDEFLKTWYQIFLKDTRILIGLKMTNPLYSNYTSSRHTFLDGLSMLGCTAPVILAS